jgi:AAA+ ATPase superfamily predicted ATPase
LTSGYKKLKIATVVTVTEVAMKFYDRQKELEILNSIYKQCEVDYGSITVLTGRRRVGKTLLSKEFAKDKKHLYFFTSKKAEPLLCSELKEEYESFSGQKIVGEVKSFPILFEQLMIYGIDNPYVLIIDEFQEFYNINKSIYSDIQNIWDQYKFKTKVHIIFIGSIYSMMIKIFQDSKEPLYGRADRILYIKPFEPDVIKEILDDYGIYSTQRLFYLYLITGGVPRYLEILLRAQCFDFDKILDIILEKDSFFIGEGKNLLIQEFGKDYGIYFSILELISTGRTSRSEIESIFEKSIGGYLEKLEAEYDVIERVKPLGSKKLGKNQKYRIKDNFIKFWFRYIYKNIRLIEDERYELIKNLIIKDLSTYSGPILEKLFIALKKKNPEYGLIGTYWERKNLNEIDIVALNEITNQIVISEVKLNHEKINISKLKNKSENLIKKYNNYEPVFEGLSLKNIDDFLLIDKKL